MSIASFALIRVIARIYLLQSGSRTTLYTRLEMYKACGAIMYLFLLDKRIYVMTFETLLFY